MGDTAYASNAILVLDNIFRGTGGKDLQLAESDIAITARIRVFDFNTKEHFLQPTFVLKDSSFVMPVEAEKEDLGLKVSFDKINTETGKISLKIQESNASKRDFVIMKAVVFPYINLLWIGAILTVIGILFSVYTRIKKG